MNAPAIASILCVLASVGYGFKGDGLEGGVWFCGAVLCAILAEIKERA